MRRSYLVVFILSTLIIAIGCGVPEDKHNAVFKDLQNCKSMLAATKNSLATTEGERNTLKSKLTSLSADRNALAARLGATKKEIAELRKARAAAEARSQVFRDLMKRLQDMISAGKLKVVIRKGRMIVKLDDKILFDPAKTKLKDDGKEALKQLAAVLKDISKRDFLVAGHTDNVPIKTRKYPSNWDLSAARAVEVVKFLQNEGVDPKHLGAAGFSEHDPVGDNSTDDGRRTNRRIEIVLMPNIEELPKIDQ
jgi:chemotaxis protein MotB